MKPVEASAHISAIHVTEHTLTPQGYALYTLQITGKTLFMPTPQVYNIKQRYSEILELHRCLSTIYEPYFTSTHTAMPLFPPKKFFNNTSQEFIHQRMQQLEAYFQELFDSVLYIATSIELIEFCRPTKADIIVCGCTKSKGILIEQLLSQISKSDEERLIMNSAPALLKKKEEEADQSKL